MQEDNLQKERCIFPPLFGYNSAFLFHRLKYGFVPQSPCRFRTRKYHAVMMADGLCLVRARLCWTLTYTDTSCAGKGSKTAFLKWIAALFR